MAQQVPAATNFPVPAPRPLSEQKICFIISPIGPEGTQKHKEFKEILDFIITPAIVSSGYDITVLRADDINRAGSFIKDILDSIYSSFVVIADLTGQNPNVFYELGVRHALRPRTILMAQSLDDIPSDLREYRTIEYDTSAKGAASFAKRLKQFLDEMHKDPDRPDNPVLDRLGSISDNRIALLEAEKQDLKNQLSSVLKTGELKKKVAARNTASTAAVRFDRIIQIMNAKQQIVGGRFKRGEETYSLPARQGDFNLYFVFEKQRYHDTWYAAVYVNEFDIQDELADVRVLMQHCFNQGKAKCKFIMVTNADLTSHKDRINQLFNTIKTKLPPESNDLFDLSIWDDSGLLHIEKELGLKV